MLVFSLWNSFTKNYRHRQKLRFSSLRWKNKCTIAVTTTTIITTTAATTISAIIVVTITTITATAIKNDNKKTAIAIKVMKITSNNNIEIYWRINVFCYIQEKMWLMKLFSCLLITTMFLPIIIQEKFSTVSKIKLTEK